MGRIIGGGLKLKAGDVVNGKGFRGRIVGEHKREPVPQWVADEIKATWNAAREAGGEMAAFRIIERMTDRLGYGRTENNPSLALPNRD